jgi:5-methylcytosine-specific restriction endonuclease McrA
MAIVSACPTCGRPKPCAAHARNDNRRRADKSKAHGLTAARWRRTRAAVLKRDGGFCRLQLRGCTTTATTVHRLPEHGTFHDGNLDAYVSACAHCHGVVDGARAH